MPSPLARVNVRSDLWETLWSFAHRVLAVNLLLAAAGAPLMLALATVAAPWRYPVFFGLLAVPLAPVVAGAFGYYALDDDRPPMKALLRLVRVHVRRSLLVAAVAGALIGVLAVDLKVMADWFPGALPLLVVLMVLVGVGALNALVLVGTQPDLRFTALLRLAVYIGVRGWALSLVSFVVLTVALIIVSQVPLAGLAIVPGCALWVVHTNTQFQLARSRNPSAP